MCANRGETFDFSLLRNLWFNNSGKTVAGSCGFARRKKHTLPIEQIIDRGDR